MSKPTESVWVRRIISVVVKNKLLKMTSLDEQILVVEKDIVEVKIKIQTVEKAADDCTDPEEKKQLRDKEKQLREKETQLRDKELILLNAKHHPTGINILDGWVYMSCDTSLTIDTWLCHMIRHLLSMPGLVI
jgi:uncharacterized protein YhaN